MVRQQAVHTGAGSLRFDGERDEWQVPKRLISRAAIHQFWTGSEGMRIATEACEPPGSLDDFALGALAGKKIAVR